jgi:hypothetical protein
MFVVSNISVILACEIISQRLISSLDHQSHQVSLTAAGTSEDINLGSINIQVENVAQYASLILLVQDSSVKGQ